MATTLETPLETSEPTGPILQPVLGRRWAFTPLHLALFGLLGTLGVLLNYFPLRATDLWSHISYGRWILEHRALPTNDPWMPLAEGMTLVNGSWLSQVILATVEARGGAEALVSLFTFTAWLSFVLIARACYLQSRSVGLTLLAVAVAIALGWSRLATIRPEMFATLCFTALLWLLVRSGWTTPETQPPLGRRGQLLLWLGVPTVMMLWANLHGSFFTGLALLGCVALGRMIEVLWTTRSLRALVADRQWHRWMILGEIAAAATLINPYGIDLWINAWQFNANVNVRTLLEWSPLTLTGVGGREFAISCVLLVVVLRLSRRRLPVADALMLGLFAFLAASHIRMIGWYAPVFVVVLSPHLADIVAQYWPQLKRSWPGRLCRIRSWKLTLICLLTAWAAFSLTTLSRPLLGGQVRPVEQLLGRETPLGLTQYLRKHPPQGLVYNPQWWGDWLTFAGPSGYQPMVTSHVHALPREVWRDYQRISYLEPGWEGVADRYGLHTLVVDKENQAVLARVLRRSGTWTPRYEDDQAVVFTRARRPLVTDPPKPAAQPEDTAQPEAAAEPENTAQPAAAAQPEAPAAPAAAEPK